MRRCKNKNAPIGVFDSGLGGLTVVRQLMKQLPHENIVYYGDTARVPYGTKSKEAIIRFSVENTNILLKNKVKLVVVACNSSSSYAMPTLRKNFSIPIIDVIDPGAKKATVSTQNQKVGVIATSATIASGSYEKAIRKYNSTIFVMSQACPLFVPIIEEGWANKTIAQDVAAEYCKSLKQRKVDTVILGCTHYPLIKNTLKKVLGAKTTLIDSAREVASVVANTLAENNIQRVQKSKAKYKFIISDRPQEFQKVAKRFLGVDINNIVLG